MKETIHMFEKKLFKSGIIFSKVGFLFLLLVLTFVNTHTSYIAKKPRAFMLNNIVLPLTAGAATWFIAWNRSSEAFTKVFITFLFLFFLQVCREMSGYYAFTGNDDSEEKQISGKNLIIAGSIISVISILLFVLSMYINQVIPNKMKVGFGIETLVFVVLMTFGEQFTTVTHGGKLISKDLFITILLMFGTHVVLQKGGFYEHVFRH